MVVWRLVENFPVHPYVDTTDRNCGHIATAVSEFHLKQIGSRNESNARGYIRNFVRANGGSDCCKHIESAST